MREDPQRGDWPPNAAAPGQIPAGMQDRLAGTNWERPTPVGGGYRWARHSVQRGERFEAVILIVPAGGKPVTDDRDQLRAIDRAADDGELSSGKFRLGYRNLPVFVIEH